jgi:hypothetical protein
MKTAMSVIMKRLRGRGGAAFVGIAGRRRRVISIDLSSFVIYFIVLSAERERVDIIISVGVQGSHFGFARPITWAGPRNSET